MKLPSNRQFGIIFSIFFFILSIYFYTTNSLPIYLVAFSTLGIIFLILGIKNSKTLNPLNLIWTKFGIILGKIISPVILGIIYFLVVSPIGIFMRLIKKDILNLKFSDKKTYWIKKDKIKSKMKNQF
tara:strand:+ start:741 stop:1121 length:381 start_codon:yes stop_codon:yes gene_type:complete